ncbi:peptidoglycan DD-metalloendopeptidase family protein [Chiayiivirga flava]|uniref:Lipoprotein NlpD n=1 Tax=Chiayiivirga flava TaxID=659595 RepID=A0A7W8D704_9GAMM|nr:peptidoglycan DD-metalloendopeptidase family protein [Chiayiivirga flava]MBB5209083.1 lipoprotein NlpD [Chiayiivirga flava]
MTRADLHQPRTWALAALACVCMVLAACSARPRAVVVDRSVDRNVPSSSAPRSQPARGDYTVRRGDTLYGIAFRHGLDFRDLARRNGIASPYTIYPGQRLRLSGSAVAAAPGPAPTTTAPRPAPPRPTAPGSAAPVRPPAATPATGTPVASTPPSAAAPATPPPAPVTTPVAGGPSRSVQGLSWRWPASGQIVGKYVAGDPTRQGLNIAGSAGQAVNAAADGEVVYSGSGLIGYGELVIIKHSDTFLSAYGHNRKRLVAEGQRVKAGQQIAEMGRSGAARDMLHFEIRKNGKPVDPMPFLPAR